MQAAENAIRFFEREAAFSIQHVVNVRLRDTRDPRQASLSQFARSGQAHGGTR